MPELTVKGRIIDALEQSPDGLSRSELSRRVNCNPGNFRRNLHQLLEGGEVTVTTEVRSYGETAVHRLADQRALQRERGQTEMPVGEGDADGPGYETTLT